MRFGYHCYHLQSCHMVIVYSDFLFLCTIRNAKVAGSLPLSQEYERQLGDMKRLLAS